MKTDVETTACPYCMQAEPSYWASENGWAVVKCQKCGFLYCNRRPSQASREQSTQLGIHVAGSDLDITERRVPGKVELYRRVLGRMFIDVWERDQPISWIDVGAGYGEIVEAVQKLAPKGSTIVGLEPMQPKLNAARAKGLEIIEGYIDENTPVYQYVSIINVFSHIYNFDAFLQQIRTILVEDGELFIETGDMSDVHVRSQLPSELGLPDHVAFASKRHLEGFLKRNGFTVIAVESVQTDTFLFAIKTFVKCMIGRDVKIRMPYTSPYRSIRVRAKKLVSGLGSDDRFSIPSPQCDILCK